MAQITATDDQVIQFSKLWMDRYASYGRLQRQSLEENLRDQTYYAILYDDNRCLRHMSHQQSMDNVWREMDKEAGITPPEPEKKVSLVMKGQFYYTEDQQPLPIIQCSDFSLYKRHLDHEDIRPILEDRASVGFNCLRVWLMNTSVVSGGILPSMYQEFYSQLPTFLDECAKYGLLVELTAFTQTKTLMPNVEDQRRHWLDVQEWTSSHPRILELVNEDDQHDNAVDSSLRQMQHSGICNSGSNGADSQPPIPVWSEVLYHSNDLSEWHRKVGHNVMEPADHYHCPGRSNENTRPDRDGNTTHFFDAAAGAALLCAGACFHCEEGKQSIVFGPSRPFAEQWVAGFRSVPMTPEYRLGQYYRRDDLLTPELLRVYERRLASGSWIVKIRA